MNNKNKPKIFYIAAIGPTVRSFLEPHLTTLSEAGYDVYLICTKDQQALEVVARTKVDFIPVKIDTDISPLSDFKSLCHLTRIFFRHRPNVVHAHMSKAGLLSMIAACLCRVPIRIYHNHGMALFSSTGLKRVVLGTIERITCNLATKIIFCGKSTLNESVSRNVCTKSKAIVIGNGTISGIKLSRFRKASSEATTVELRKKYEVSESSFTVGFVGRIVAHKGIDNIIEAWPLVNNNCDKPVELIFAGGHDNNNLFYRLTALCNENENVRHLGRVDTITDIYQILDVLILPSWHEGFPYSVLEAQSIGVPAIVTEVTGNIDAVLPGVTGLHIAVESPTALAEAIIKIAENPELRQEMSQAAEQRITQNYSEETVLQNLRVFYKTLLQ